MTTPFYAPPQKYHFAFTGQPMLKALILGLAISCLLLGIECLVVAQIKLPQDDSRIVIIPEIFGWLLIGIGSSTTLYTLINRSSSLACSSDLETTTIGTDEGSASLHQWDTTDYDLTEHYHDDEEADEEHEEYDAEDDATDDEDYFESDEDDESEPEFDLEKFNQQFDIDELLDE